MYPERVEDVMPTRLGNALKAAETYGRNRWNIDALTLWYELVSAAPEVLHRELNDTRSAMDFFAAMIVQFILLGSVSLVLIPQADNLAPLWVAAGVLLLVVPSYSALVGRVSAYRSVIQALVNVGRMPVASNMAYRLPATIDEERFFWNRLSSYCLFGELDRVREIDDYRWRSDESD
jgi:hypothetical protein